MKTLTHSPAQGTDGRYKTLIFITGGTTTNLAPRVVDTAEQGRRDAFNRLRLLLPLVGKGDGWMTPNYCNSCYPNYQGSGGCSRSCHSAAALAGAR